jgi:hypothetical protein
LSAASGISNLPPFGADKPLPVPEIAQRAEQVAILVRAAEQSPADAEVREIESQLAAADDWIRRRVVGTTQTLGSLPSANALQTS